MTSRAITSKPTPQWDVSQTAFNSAETLRGLIRALSRDDVHPGAVLAAEALGMGILASPTRITEAVTALGGEDSMKWDEIKTLIGLRTNGVVKAIRESTALIQFFLLASACKLVYTGNELGNIFFECIAQSGVLHLHPVSIGQLARFVDAMSGHCDAIAPIDHMHQIAVAVDATSIRDFRFFDRLENDVLADILIQTFNHLRDDTVASITLEGAHCGIWLATLFSWLLPDKTSISVEGQLISGHGGTQLCIDLLTRKGPWELHVWTQAGDPTEFIFKDPESPSPVEEIPLKLAKSYYAQYYFYNDSEIFTLGVIAGAFIAYLTENGRVYSQLPLQSPCSTYLRNIQSMTWIGSYGQAMCAYGWDESIFKESQSLLSQICTPADFSDLERKFSYLRPVGNYSHGRTPSSAITIAKHLAVDAIATSTCDVHSGNRKHEPLRVHHEAKNLKFLSKLMDGDGLSLEDFRVMAFERLLPSCAPQHNDLAISIDGLVLAWSSLWSSSTRQRDVFSLRLFRGGIQREGLRYEKIVERFDKSDYDRSDLKTSNGPPSPIKLFEGETYTGLVPAREMNTYSVKTIVSSSRTALNVRYELHTSIHRPIRVSMLDAITLLATATHISKANELTIQQERYLASALQERDLRACWSSIFNISGGLSIEYDYRKVILATSNHQELRFWATTVLRNLRIGGEYPLVVGYSGPLLSLINAAEKDFSEKGWIIIC